MSNLSLQRILSRRGEPSRFRLLDLLLILLGVAIAHWLIPGPLEGPGF